MVITGYAVLFDQPDRAGRCFSRKIKLGGITEVPVCIPQIPWDTTIGAAFLKKTKYGIKYYAYITNLEYAEILKKYIDQYVLSIYVKNPKVDRNDKITYFDFDIIKLLLIDKQRSMWDRDKLRIKVQ